MFAQVIAQRTARSLELKKLLRQKLHLLRHSLSILMEIQLHRVHVKLW